MSSAAVVIGAARVKVLGYKFFLRFITYIFVATNTLLLDQPLYNVKLLDTLIFSFLQSHNRFYISERNIGLFISHTFIATNMLLLDRPLYNAKLLDILFLFFTEPQ